MRIIITEVNYRAFKPNKYNVLKDEEFEIQFLPMKGDVILLDDIRYKVEQRDFFFKLGVQCIHLYVTKTYI